MWSWIPIIGPILQAAVNAFAKYEDVSVQKAKINSDQTVATGAQDVEVVQIRADLAKSFANDIGVIFARDVILNWYAVYVSLVFYDSCFRNALPGWMTWRVLAIPNSLSYLCSGIVAFLFVSAWRDK